MLDEYIYSLLYVLFLMTLVIMIFSLFSNYYQSKQISSKTIYYSTKISGQIGYTCDNIPDPSYYIKVPIYNSSSDDVVWYCISTIELR